MNEHKRGCKGEEYASANHAFRGTCIYGFIFRDDLGHPAVFCAASPSSIAQVAFEHGQLDAKPAGICVPSPQMPGPQRP
jgi:hypothetical protein